MNRRTFVRNSSLALGAVTMTGAIDIERSRPKLSFSTLGCPDWSLEKIFDFAAKYRYDAIEIRGLLREMDLTKSPVFSSANIRSTLEKARDRNIKFAGLGSSAQMHHEDAKKRKEQLDEARRFIDLAHELKCPFVRVFPEQVPDDANKMKTLDLIVSGLLELGEYSKASKVTVLLESHGGLVLADDLLHVMKNAEHDYVGMIWDISNMWVVTRESPRDVYDKLKKYIRHTHIKDGKVSDKKINYTLLGKGDLPIAESVAILREGGYKGYYGFEWEKLWHPEIQEPEVAFPQFSEEMRNILNSKLKS